MHGIPLGRHGGRGARAAVRARRRCEDPRRRDGPRPPASTRRGARERVALRRSPGAAAADRRPRRCDRGWRARDAPDAHASRGHPTAPRLDRDRGRDGRRLADPGRRHDRRQRLQRLARGRHAATAARRRCRGRALASVARRAHDPARGLRGRTSAAWTATGRARDRLAPCPRSRPGPARSTSRSRRAGDGGRARRARGTDRRCRATGHLATPGSRCARSRRVPSVRGRPRGRSSTATGEPEAIAEAGELLAAKPNRSTTRERRPATADTSCRACSRAPCRRRASSGRPRERRHRDGQRPLHGHRQRAASRIDVAPAETLL